ncbi:hypothetical protein B0A55_01277 [Friedmanniomyces simplex]|uniref:Uncharacterized protein n=1 Tax=Friedmanniomyces simplex TaxID=329884 RepID=A0A4U0Y0V0_9PEZI|nr:hypothetical protein B0A55_01277 [Friedmanniomyces simplex]
MIRLRCFHLLIVDGAVPLGKEHGGGSDQDGTPEKGFKKFLEQQTPETETGTKQKQIRLDHDAVRKLAVQMYVYAYRHVKLVDGSFIANARVGRELTDKRRHPDPEFEAPLKHNLDATYTRIMN